jgi:hypothetical protein
MIKIGLLIITCSINLKKNSSDLRFNLNELANVCDDSCRWSPYLAIPRLTLDMVFNFLQCVYNCIRSKYFIQIRSDLLKGSQVRSVTGHADAPSNSLTHSLTHSPTRSSRTHCSYFPLSKSSLKYSNCVEEPLPLHCRC